MRVLFMVFCQMSQSERSPEHPGKGRRVRSGSRRLRSQPLTPCPWRAEVTRKRTRLGHADPGEVSFSLPEDREDSARMHGAAGEGWGRPPGARGSPQRGGTASPKPVLLHEQRWSCRPAGQHAPPDERADLPLAAVAPSAEDQGLLGGDSHLRPG